MSKYGTAQEITDGAVDAALDETIWMLEDEGDSPYTREEIKWAFARSLMRKGIKMLADEKEEAYLRKQQEDGP